LDVLDYIHRQNIVYRDLKPGNVKMSPEGHVKLLDFGIARLHQIGKAQDTIILGTPGFSPPEQYGTGQTDARSDLYSLAAMLYFLLTGRDNSRTPFVYPPLRTLRPDVSRSFEESLARALQLSPEARFSNAKAFRDALERREFVLIQERVFSYGIPPPRLNDYISGAAILLALPVGLLFLVPDAVTLPLAALGLLLSSIPVRLYLTCRRKSATRLRVSESGIEYTDDSRTITCSWDEVEELIFQHSADATVEAGEVRVMTAKGTFSFDTAPYGHPPASTPGGLKSRRSPTLVLLEKGPELTEIIINRGGLLPRFAGSNSFVRKKE
jgi:serine/threonine protein kinase